MRMTEQEVPIRTEAGVEMSLDAARTSAYATSPYPASASIPAGCDCSYALIALSWFRI
jgi:hypothetical protein